MSDSARCYGGPDTIVGERQERRATESDRELQARENALIANGTKARVVDGVGCSIGGLRVLRSR